ncbi:MAG: hypothetical protein OEX97_06900, partial [Acidimicrobiia bacterium]|nr:hypothetical protein [Acidimicrobiia bacterium]
MAMKNWRTPLIAAAVGALVLGAGYLIERAPAEGAGPSTNQDSRTDAVLACAPALMPACEDLADQLGTTARIYRTGTDPGRGTVVIAPSADLAQDLEVGASVARSPIAIAIWQDRESILRSHCGGTIDLACLSTSYGETWKALGGLESWGSFKLGLADPAVSEAGLASWRAVAGSGVPSGLAAGLRLTATDDAGLMADVLLF